MAAKAPEKLSYSTLLKNRSFSYFFVGQLISESGDAVFDVALLWFVLVTTGSTALVGLTNAAVLLPAVFLSPVAGVYADRSNRRDLMIASNLVQGVVTAVVAVLYVTSSLSFSLLIFLVLALYSGAQFYRAASGAIVPRIVSRENLGAANGLLSLSTSLNQLLGYSVGGIIIIALGPAVPITYDSATFFIAAVFLMLIARASGQPRMDGAGVPPAPSFSRDFREGLRYVRRSRIFLQLIFFGLLVNFFATAVFALLSPYAKLWLHGDASTYGFVLSAFALGSIVGAVLVGRINFRAYVGKLVFLGVIATGALLLLAGLTTSIPLALLVFLAMGMILAVVNVPLNVLVQTQVPGEMLGRAGTVLTSLLTAAQPVAAVTAGVLATYASIGSVVAGSGAAVVVTSVALFPLFKELRNASY